MPSIPGRHSSSQSQPASLTPQNFTDGLWYKTHISISALLLVFFAVVYNFSPVFNPSLEQRLQEADSWRKAQTTVLYESTTNEELTNATKWLTYARPFDPKRLTKRFPLCTQIANALAEQIRAFKRVQPHTVNNQPRDQALAAHLTYHSNRLAGNHLELLDVGLILAGKRISPSPAFPDAQIYVNAGKDINETNNHAVALRYLARELLTPIRWSELIPEINWVLLHGCSPTTGHISEAFRKVPVTPGIHKVLLPQPEEIPKLMELYETWLNNQIQQVKDEFDAISVAADAHAKLVQIYPFGDGNGRTARIVDAMVLSKFGLPPPLFDSEHPNEYMKAIEAACRPDRMWDLKSFANVHAKAVIETIKLWQFHVPSPD